MKELSIREMRASLGQLDRLLEKEGEIVLTRRGTRVARVLPMKQARELPSHRDLRKRMPLLASSAELVRADRDERG
jgi:antitoxin (DNA-binding transcriptional repressor) of toxin-antitoxin stability system